MLFVCCYIRFYRNIVSIIPTIICDNTINTPTIVKKPRPDNLSMFDTSPCLFYNFLGFIN
nr:MAG TPA: hypothetical protein [Caudoviricetes sp.]